MKNISVAFLFCLISSIVNAQAFQTNKLVLCDDTKKLISALNENWNEKLVWAGNDSTDKSRYGLFVNSKTGSWTLLQLTPEIACIVGVGDNSKLNLGPTV